MLQTLIKEPLGGLYQHTFSDGAVDKTSGLFYVFRSNNLTLGVGSNPQIDKEWYFFLLIYLLYIFNYNKFL